MRSVQREILEFIEGEAILPKISLPEKDEAYQRKIQLVEVLHLIENIANNHHRCPNFFDRIEALLLYFQDDLTKLFTNTEIFNIFCSNKRILLFLFQKGIIKSDKALFSKIQQLSDYYTFLKNPQKDQNFTQEEVDNFEKNRQQGENDNLICTLIRQDSIVDFVKYVNEVNLPIDSQIPDSIFETNSFLNLESPTLIEYAAFFGSIQIFKYLATNQAEMTSSLWLYSIHSNNPELIEFLEENGVDFPDESCKKILIESIKTFSDNISEYIENNYLKSSDDGIKFCDAVQFHNYEFLSEIESTYENLKYLVQFDYPMLVDLFINEYKFDINKVFIMKPDEFVAEEETFLSIALKSENYEIVRLLLTKDIDVNKIIKNEKIIYNQKEIKEKTALSVAVESGNKEIVQILLNKKDILLNQVIKQYNNYDENEIDETALTIAIKNNNIEIVELLLSNPNIDVNLVIYSRTCSFDNNNDDHDEIVKYYRENANHEYCNYGIDEGDIFFEEREKYNVLLLYY